jgi:S-disulfanyl-L-cysteine oxidoreductase SoxD
MSRSLKLILAALLTGAVLGGGAMFVFFRADAPPAAAADGELAAPGVPGIGREATAEEIAGWDIDVRPDGHGLPPGKGTVAQGETLYNEQCASCHGEFGESAGRWPMLAGGDGSISGGDPVKTVGSYWPYAATLLDYIRRAMPYGNAQSLSNDELYAVTAFVLYLNNIIEDEEFELSGENFASMRLPNEAHFKDDDREAAEKQFWQHPCMTNCVPGEAKIIGRARMLDVTPEAGQHPAAE